MRHNKEATSFREPKSTPSHVTRHAPFHLSRKTAQAFMMMDDQDAGTDRQFEQEQIAWALRDCTPISQPHTTPTDTPSNETPHQHHLCPGLPIFCCCKRSTQPRATADQYQYLTRAMAPISPTTFVAMLALLLSPASAFVAPAGLAGFRHQPGSSSSSSRFASSTSARTSLRQSLTPPASVRLGMVSELAEEKVRAWTTSIEHATRTCIYSYNFTSTCEERREF